MKDYYQIIQKSQNQSNLFLATIISGKNDGEKAIFENGQLIFTSKQGCFTEEMCREIVSCTQSRLIKIDEISMFCEQCGSMKKMVICGGGTLSIPIIQLGKILGFHVTVIEDRLSFANNTREVGADAVICDSFASALQCIDSGHSTYFVIVTRGHRHDLACAKEVIVKKNAYIGMIGSRSRAVRMKEELLEYCQEHQIDKQVLDHIYSPIGLAIGANTPEEIAVSIFAEIISIKNKKEQSLSFSEEMLSKILEEEQTNSMVLATIIQKTGSAPRSVGTKMIIGIDGSQVGSIGGGCAEAELCTYVRTVFMKKEKQTECFQLDLSNELAENDGMICGGTIKLLIEKI